MRMPSLLDTLVLSTLCGALLAGGGCTSLNRQVPLANTLQFNRNGQALDPSQRRMPPLCSVSKQQQRSGELQPHCSAFDEYLDRIFLAARAHQREGKINLLLFIHGGLNSTNDTLRRAVYLTEPMIDAHYYPIFINWDASLTGSYGAHLMHLRQGEYVSDWYLSPFIFLTDALRAIGQLPIVTFQAAKNAVESARLGRSDLQKTAIDRYCQFRRQFESGKAGPAVSRGQEQKTSFGVSFRRTLESADDFLSLPLQAVAFDIVDAAGPGSWDVMSRNVELLFRQDAGYGELPLASGDTDRIESHGDLIRFLKRLEEEVKSDPPGTWTITLVSHSMGAIVANRILRSTDLHFDDIVYMAAACSIEDYEQSMFPYLRRPENLSRTEVHHLMLHDVAEANDDSATFSNVFGKLGIKGSLLVWIDNFLTSPLTLRQRTAGRFVNFFYALGDTPLDLLPQISVKVFSNDRHTYDPKRHGDFAAFDKTGPKFAFFTEAFWKPDAAANIDACCFDEEIRDPNCR